MSEYREYLVDCMIRLYGFEDKKVIAFSNLCEKYPDSDEWDNTLWVIVRSHQDFPVTDEE